MTEPYYNVTADGAGLGGFINYANKLVNGWFATSFLTMIFIISIVVGAKSEWKMSSIVGFAAFLTLILGMIMQLFTSVSTIFLFAMGIILAGSIGWSKIEGSS